MTEPSRNVELKAHDPDPARTLERALAAGARDEGLLRQRDTYFHVPAGRLKLREQEPGGATLIAYERPDEAAERVSSYRLVEVPDAGALRDALAAAPDARAAFIVSPTYYGMAADVAACEIGRASCRERVCWIV